MSTSDYVDINLLNSYEMTALVNRVGGKKKNTECVRGKKWADHGEEVEDNPKYEKRTNARDDSMNDA